MRDDILANAGRSPEKRYPEVIELKDFMYSNNPSRFTAAQKCVMESLLCHYAHLISYDGGTTNAYTTDNIQNKLQMLVTVIEGLRLQNDNTFKIPNTDLIFQLK